MGETENSCVCSHRFFCCHVGVDEGCEDDGHAFLMLMDEMSECLCIASRCGVVAVHVWIIDDGCVELS